jgi:uncharacterized membrane protein
MAYYGTGSYYTFCILLLVVGAVLDNREVSKLTIGACSKAGVYLASFGAIVLAATALYIDYTPVRYGTINGCQLRYILPVVFPVLYCISELNLKVSEKILKNVYVLGMGGMSIIFLYNVYNMCVFMY